MMSVAYYYPGTITQLDATVGSADDNNDTTYTSPTFTTTGTGYELVIACAGYGSWGVMKAGSIGGQAATLRTVIGWGDGTGDGACEDYIFTSSKSAITASIVGPSAFQWAGILGAFK